MLPEFESSARPMWGAATICQVIALLWPQNAKQFCRDKGLAAPEIAC